MAEQLPHVFVRRLSRPEAHGIFGRSYIRSYAQAVGLDPDATVREFAESHAIDPAPAPLSELREKTAERSTARRPPTRLQFLIDSAIDAFHTRRAEFNHKYESPEPEPASDAPVGLSFPPARETANASTPVVDFLGLAKLCAKLSCAQHVQELTSVLEDASGVLDSVGLILWIPDAVGVALIPAFAHGYPDEMIAQLPGVSMKPRALPASSTGQ